MFEVTEVRITLFSPRGNSPERLLAFASIVLDGGFAIKDIKVLDGEKGFFVAMPSRHILDRCPACHTKNHLQARYCNDCGSRLAGNRAMIGSHGTLSLFADIAHPVTRECREVIETAVILAYREELCWARQADQDGFVMRNGKAV